MVIRHTFDFAHGARLVMCCLVAAVTWSSSGSAWAARYAWVVGNSNYSQRELWGDLPGARIDAAQVARALREAGFVVINSAHTTDLSREQMQQQFEDLVQKLTPNDQLVVYFSGHGLRMNDADFLVPTDATAETVRTSEGLVSVDYLMGQVNQRRAGFAVFIFDACRSSPTRDKAMANSSASGVARLNVIPREPLHANQIAIYSASETENSIDHPDGGGIFTIELLRELSRSTSRNVSIRDLMLKVREAVQTRVGVVRVGARQTPVVKVKGDVMAASFDFVNRRSLFGEEVVSANGPAVAAIPAAATTGGRDVGDPSEQDAAADERTFWLGIERAKEKQPFMRYLAKYPQGKFSETALERVGRTTTTKEGCLMAGGGGNVGGWVASWSGACVGGIAQGQGTLTGSHADRGQFTWRGTLDFGVRVGVWTLDYRESKAYRDTVVTSSSDTPASRTIAYDRTGDVMAQQSIVFKSGATYEGDTNAAATNPQGSPHGYGVMKFPAGARFAGDWVAGRKSGRGSLTYRDGSRYEGGWSVDKPHGYGRYFDASGRLKYAGPHIDGKATGPNEVR